MNFEKRLIKEISAWQQANVITDEQAASIKRLYSDKDKPDVNILLIIFSVLGALLIGGGIILIIARNWSEFPIAARVCFSFLPLAASQALTAYILYKKIRGAAWREGAAIFYSISVFACVALVSQIFHLYDDFSMFVLICSILAFPICYVLDATMPVLVYIAGITVWAVSFNEYKMLVNILVYLLLMLPIIPYVLRRLKANISGAHTQLILWFLTLSGYFAFLRTFYDVGLLLIMMCVYSTTLYMISRHPPIHNLPIRLNPMRILGFLGVIGALYTVSIDFEYWIGYYYKSEDVWPYITILCIMGALYALLLYKRIKEDSKFIKIAQPVSICASAPIIILLGKFHDASQYNFNMGFCVAIISLYLIALGVALVINGLADMSFFTSCVGVLIISLIILIRFFDYSYSFWVRGIGFIFIGAMFLAANMLISNRIKMEAAIGDDSD